MQTIYILALLPILLLIPQTFCEKCPTPYEKFVDPLPIPPVLKPKGSNVTVTLSQFKQRLHRDLPPVTVWGFDGTYPGPTFDVRQGESIRVTWVNGLPMEPLLPTKPLMPGPNVTQSRTIVHLHGGKTPPESDGYPTDWYLPGYSKDSIYPNDQQGAMLWYHGHSNNLARVHIYSGLAGMYFIRDALEDSLNLPEGPYEIPLMVQDKTIDANESKLFYPYEWIEEFFGEVALVNGKIFPYLDVEPTLYRFRIINACNARFLNLSFSSDQWFHQIGGDGGLLQHSVKLNYLLIAPAERADLLVDFSMLKGEQITLENNAATPFPDPDSDACELPKIMQFRVSKTGVKKGFTIPTTLAPSRKPSLSSVTTVRKITISEIEKSDGGVLISLLEGRKFSEPVIDTPKLNSVEIWEFINLTPDNHPMHIHLVQFHIIDRQAFDVEAYIVSGLLIYTDDPVLPDPNESGPKDTVRADPGMVTRVLIHFQGYVGNYVFHCHILEHEDNDMMRPYVVIP